MPDKVLQVPYLSQRDNKSAPSSTCNVTAFSMVFKYYGVKGDGSQTQLEDQQYYWMLDKGLDRLNHQHLSILGNRYKSSLGLTSEFHNNWGIQDLIKEVDRGNPVVLAGYFTNSGHIVCVVGYNQGTKEVIINDSWGEWSPNGYQHYPGAGKGSRFKYATLERLCCDPGETKSMWCHSFTKK